MSLTALSSPVHSSSERDAYRHIAKVYDYVTGAFLSGPHLRLAELCRKKGVRRVLDMGCGTGLLTTQLCESMPFTVGLDVSAAMLGRAARKLHSRFSLVQADGAYPPFLPNSFDAVTLSLVLHEAGPQADGLLKTALSLAPLVVVLEWRAPERNLDYLATAWPHIIERLAGKEHYQGFRHYLRRGGVYGLARRAGGRVTEAVTLKAGSLILAAISKENTEA